MEKGEKESDGGNLAVFLIIQQLNLELQSPLWEGKKKPAMTISIIRAQGRAAVRKSADCGAEDPRGSWVRVGGNNWKEAAGWEGRRSATRRDQKDGKKPNG